MKKLLFHLLTFSLLLPTTVAITSCGHDEPISNNTGNTNDSVNNSDDTSSTGKWDHSNKTDDQPSNNSEKHPIVGVWTFTQTETNDYGNTESFTTTLTFKNDRTGSILENWDSESRTTTHEQYSMDFSWTTSTDSNGNDILHISYVSGDKNTEIFPGTSSTVLWNRLFIQTGNILNIFDPDGGIWVLHKK